MWYGYDVLYAVLYVCVSCFVVRGCAVSRRYIHVCNCDMFSVVNVYLDHLKLCVLMVEGMSVVVNVTLSLMSVIVQPIGTHDGEVMYFGCVCFRVELGFLNCDDICMWGPIYLIFSIQFYLGFPYQALSLLDSVLVSILSHGSLYECARAQYLRSRCKVAIAAKHDISSLNTG